jgi:hypothetical protein
MRRVSALRQPKPLSRPDIRAPVVGDRISRFLDDNGTLVIAIGAFAITLVSALRAGLVTDGWMALMTGRDVASHGLPSHDTFTIWAGGRRWVDQQWLSQLTLYGLWRVGGLKLALLAHAALAVGGLAGAATIARRLGASARSTTWIVVLALVCYYPAASVMRTQSVTYPLFITIFWLLASDARKPSRKVFFTLPLLILWANIHGSSLLGASLVALAGLVGAASAFVVDREVSVRALALAVLPWPCLLASPYALELPRYYDTVVVGGGFGNFVTEWEPTTLTVLTIPFYLLVLGGIWLLGRGGPGATSFEKLAFVITAVLGFEAIRNLVWFALVAVAVLPRAVDALRPAAVEPRRLNRLLATAVAAVLAVAVGGTAARPGSWFLHDFPPQAAAAASAAAGRDGTVLATSSYANWLLWTHPELAGRVAYDARFELLTRGQLRTAQHFQALVEGWRKTAGHYRVIVLNRKEDGKLRAALVRFRLASVVRVAGDIVVLRTNR